MSCCAIHAIWTTYGTWLPGDARGHWSALFDLYGNLAERGHKLNVPDPITHDRALALCKEPPRILEPPDQQIVADTIGDVLRGQLEPTARVYAGAVERTHVYLLFGPLREHVERVIGRIKGRTSSEVIKRGTERGRTRTWTAGYWKVFFFDTLAIPDLSRYIERHNERRGLPARPYAWITEFPGRQAGG